jgi:hypothetical protein
MGMKTIYKYTLDKDHNTILTMPKGAVVLTVDIQNEEICIWAKVDTNVETEERHFKMYGTGHEVLDNDTDLSYVGTVQLMSGQLIFHIYEYIK